MTIIFLVTDLNFEELFLFIYNFFLPFFIDKLYFLK